VFHKAFCRANDLPLLKIPFQKSSAEIGQCPLFSGGEPSQFGPSFLANRHADLDSPLAQPANRTSIRNDLPNLREPTYPFCAFAAG
jgi:hypothetical protein